MGGDESDKLFDFLPDCVDVNIPYFINHISFGVCLFLKCIFRPVFFVVVVFLKSFFQVIFHIVRRFSEFTEALAQRFCQIRQLFRSDD